MDLRAEYVRAFALMAFLSPRSGAGIHVMASENSHER